MRFVYPNTLQPCLHSTDQRMQTAHFPDSATQNRSTDEVWLVLDCLMRVSYICHESKLCVPHLIYQTEKNLVIMSVAHKCKPTFPFSFTLFSPGFSGHCTITRVNVT